MGEVITMDLKDYIGIRLDFPKEGISFKDITPLIQNHEAYQQTVKELIYPFKDNGITKVVCADARGFIFGGPAALELGAGLVIARKPNKLPYVAMSETYDLEYGHNTLEIPTDALSEQDRVLIVDDLLATGGSAKALTNMIHRSGATLVGYSFVVELTGLKGRDILDKVPVISLIEYEF